MVAGNLIGTNSAGTAADANYAGVEIDSGASGNLIGASGTTSVTDPLERNIISGNSLAGVWMTGTGTDNNVVAGNYIGTTISGDTALGNGTTYQYISAQLGGVGGGLVIEDGAADNLIGTTGHTPTMPASATSFRGAWRTALISTTPMAPSSPVILSVPTPLARPRFPTPTTLTFS